MSVSGYFDKKTKAPLERSPSRFFELDTSHPLSVAQSPTTKKIRPQLFPLTWGRCRRSGTPLVSRRESRATSEAAAEEPEDAPVTPQPVAHACTKSSVHTTHSQPNAAQSASTEDAVKRERRAWAQATKNAPCVSSSRSSIPSENSSFADFTAQYQEDQEEGEGEEEEEDPAQPEVELEWSRRLSGYESEVRFAREALDDARRQNCAESCENKSAVNDERSRREELVKSAGVGTNLNSTFRSPMIRVGPHLVGLRMIESSNDLSMAVLQHFLRRFAL